MGFTPSFNATVQAGLSTEERQQIIDKLNKLDGSLCASFSNAAGIGVDSSAPTNEIFVNCMGGTVDKLMEEAAKIPGIINVRMG